jgi:isoleucyl-tRNA synthetase
VEDLSVWYLRRSRDRLKSEDVDDRYSAMVTTKIVISELSKLLAPSMPFLAEDLYLKITGGMQKESVHLDVWPEYLLDEMTKDELETIEKMNETRKVVSLGLEARSKAGIKVRQPLNCLKVKTQKLTKDYLDLIKDEINVKEVVADEKISGEVELDTNITPELKEEGTVREIIRALQEIRKNKK